MEYKNPKRRALIAGVDLSVERVAAYLPENYKVVGIVVQGHDDAGWTLDDYVLPRLASGLMFGEEIQCLITEVIE